MVILPVFEVVAILFAGTTFAYAAFRFGNLEEGFYHMSVALERLKTSTTNLIATTNTLASDVRELANKIAEGGSSDVEADLLALADRMDSAVTGAHDALAIPTASDEPAPVADEATEDPGLPDGAGAALGNEPPLDTSHSSSDAPIDDDETPPADLPPLDNTAEPFPPVENDGTGDNGPPPVK